VVQRGDKLIHLGYGPVDEFIAQNQLQLQKTGAVRDAAALVFEHVKLGDWGGPSHLYLHHIGTTLSTLLFIRCELLYSIIECVYGVTQRRNSICHAIQPSEI